MSKNQSLINKLSLVSIAIVLCILVLPYRSVRAEPVKPVRGITVAPALVEMTLPSDQQMAFAAVGVRNDSDNTVTIVANLQGIDQTGGRLIPNQPLPDNLKNSLFITPTEFTLQPKQSINIQVIFKDTDQVPPGGNYAAIVIRQTKVDGSSPSTLSAISATLFINKQKGAVYKMRVSNINTKGWPLGIPTSISADYTNEGNIQLTPRGSVMYDSQNAKYTYASGIINANSVPLMPQKTINIETKLTRTDRIWWPGKYKLNYSYRYTATEQIKTIIINRWYIPTWLVVMIMFWFGTVAVTLWIVIKRKDKLVALKPKKPAKKILIDDVRKVKKPKKKPKTKPKKKKIKVKVESGTYRTKFTK